jgi:UDP-N-acetylmuramate dehydrogenase
VADDDCPHEFNGYDRRRVVRTKLEPQSALGVTMAFLSELNGAIAENESLASHTWYNLGGPARWFARPTDVDQLGLIVHQANQEGVPLYMLGEGANLLIGDDGVDGVVVTLRSAGFRDVDWKSDRHTDDGRTLVTVGAGVSMSRLTLDAVRWGMAGLERMAGIPGTLGGIIRMNAGGRYGEIGELVHDVTVVDTAGQVKTLTHEEVGFRYRTTNLEGAVVCGATLALHRDDPIALRERLLEYMQYKSSTQPLSEWTAGCVFRNPPGHSAGALIDKAGLKGTLIGGAYVSPRHANFIIAKEGARSADVLKLIALVRQRVAEQFGIELELEIEVWGRRHAPYAEAIG